MKTLALLGAAFLALGAGGLPAQGLGLGAAMDPSPGSYAAPLVLNVKAPDGASVTYRYLETPSAQTFPWSGPVTLEALPGELRVYTVRLSTSLPTGEAVTRDFRYQISRPAQAQPTVTPVPGVFTSAVTVKPVLPAGWSLTLDGSPVAGSPTLDASMGAVRTFVLEARGPAASVLSWQYTVDRRDQDALAVDVLSPVAGVWANRQPLVVAFRGTDRVLWSYGEHLDQGSARAYEGPVVLDLPGQQTVTVAAHSRLDGRWVEKTVRWTNGAASPPAAGWPDSGVLLTTLALPDAPGWTWSWDEGRSWSPAQGARTEAASSVSRKVLTLQARQDGKVSRYLWWLDARPPAVPTVGFVGGWNPLVVFSGTAEALHRVVWTKADGSSVEDPAALWGPGGSWKVPDGVVAARVKVRGVNGVEGTSATVGFAQTGWSTPEWEPWDAGLQTGSTWLPLGGRILPRPGFQAAYEVSDRADVPEPGPASPWLDGAFLPTVPWGADRTFYVRFAWRDASGLTGPSTAPVAVRVDRVPPLAPEVVQTGGQVLVKPADGEQDGMRLTWAVTTSRVDSADALTFQEYRGPLAWADLHAAAAGELWFHARAQDRAGNVGPARLNVALGSNTGNQNAVVQVDPDPSVGESPVADGGVYPWAEFRLRALDPSRDLWVGVNESAAGVPADWASRVEPWTGVFSRAVGRGERRTFLVFWNEKAGAGWAWPQPKTLTLTLDQSSPSPPVMGAWPNGTLGQAWTLTLKPGRPGDVLRYTFTVDGSVPADPASGEAWPGTRTWDAPAGGKAVVRLRVAAVSVAGLSFEAALPGPVTIDRTVPSPVAPTLDRFTYRTSGLVIPLPADSGEVRYTLTSDGTQPGVPGEASPAVAATGLPLDGSAGKSVLYRFRWRPYSAAGLAGPVSETYAVLIDRTAPPLPAPSPADTTPSLVPRLSGLPVSGVSAAAVTLRADGGEALLHYELAEGVGVPRAVSAASPAWTDLTLDPGAGVDRTYVLSVRGFSPEGRPVTDEVHYQVRVDRQPPAAPEFSLRADTRRPEAVVDVAAGSAEESFYYRWSWESYPAARGESDWRALGDQAPRFAAPGGALTRLRVQAYLKDEAGNQGPVAEKTLLIDQNVVYVTPKGSGDGSRSKPFGAVADAVEAAHLTGKAFLLVAAGSYPVPRTLDLGGLQVLGGLNPDAWEGTTVASRSLWTASAPFTGASLLESGDAPWMLDNVDLSSAVPLDRVVVVRGAAVTVRGSTWTWSGASGGWDQAGGKLTWNDISATYAAEPRGDFVDLRSAGADVRGLNLAATENQGGVLFSLQDTDGLFLDLAVVSRRASGFDAVWSATASKLTVDSARILAGDGAARATAFVLKDTEAVFFNTDVSLFASASNTGFQVTGGRWELQKSNLNLLRGEEFNQGVVADHAAVAAENFQIKVAAGSYQGGFTLDGGSLALTSGQVQLAGGGKRVWGAQFLSSSLVQLNDVGWVLDTKTPGEVWTLAKPWAQGSTVTASSASGW